MITNALFPTQFLLGRMGAKQIGLRDVIAAYVTVDAMVEESHQSNAQLTDYPIEDGSEISDHVTIKSDVLSITGIISASPIYIGPEIFATDRVTDAYYNLREMQKAGAVVNIVTGIRLYKDMIIEEFRVVRDAKNGQSLEFTMQCKQAVIVMSQTSQIQASQPIAQTKVNVGTKGTRTVSSPGGASNLVQQVRGF